MQHLIKIVFFYCIIISSSANSTPYFLPDKSLLFPVIPLHYKDRDAEVYVIKQTKGLGIYINNRGRIRFLTGQRVPEKVETVFLSNNGIVEDLFFITSKQIQEPGWFAGIHYIIFYGGVYLDKETDEIMLFFEKGPSGAFDACMEGVYSDGDKSTCEFKDEASIKAFIDPKNKITEK